MTRPHTHPESTSSEKLGQDTQTQAGSPPTQAVVSTYTLKRRIPFLRRIIESYQQDTEKRPPKKDSYLGDIQMDNKYSKYFRVLLAWMPVIVYGVAATVILLFFMLPVRILVHSAIGIVVVALLWALFIGVTAVSAWWIRRWRKELNDKIQEASETAKKSQPPLEDQNERVIILAFEKCDTEAEQYRDNRSRLSIIAALLAPFAISFLAIQTLVWREGLFACAFIGGEIIVLIVALCTIYHDRWPFKLIPRHWLPVYPHGNWVPLRLAAELLRRERSLYLVRVGPYYGYDDAAVAQKVQQRLEQFGTPYDPNTDSIDLKLDEEILLDLIEIAPWLPGDLDDKAGASSHTSGPSNAPAADGQAVQEPVGSRSTERMYLEDRLLDQKNGYYRPHERQHALLDQFYETAARLSLGLALILAFLHFRLVLVGGTSPLHKFVEVSALIMPTIGAAFLALRSFFENNRLQRSYEDQYIQLAKLEAELDTLIKEPPDEQDPHRRPFNALVQRTEVLLSAELRRWYLIVSPEHPTGG